MTRLDGADLSHFQATIDWPTLRANTWWVATKATQGVQYVDPTLQAHRAQASALAFTHSGLYHWLSPNVDAAAQAAFFLATVGALHVGEFAMLDAEEGGITVAQAQTWCEAVEAVTGRPAAIYTGAYVAGGAMWTSPALRVSKYGKRPFHLAAYTTEAKALALPGVAAYPWSAWQFSSNGPVPGVTGRCDMNRVDDRAVFDLACGITAAPAPAPQLEDDMKIATNAEQRTMPYGDAAPNTAVFVVGDFKRNIGAEEYKALYANVVPVALSNAALDAIPDYKPGSGTVDTDARAMAAEAVTGVDHIKATLKAV